MFYGHGITAAIIAPYSSGVKLCWGELPGFPGVCKDPAALLTQPGPLSRNFPPLSRRKRPPPHKRPDRIAPVGSGPCADRILHFLVRLSGKNDGPRCGDPMGRALGLPSAKGEQKSGIADIPGVVLDDPAGIHTIIRKQIARCLALRRKGGVHKPGGLAAVDHRPLKAPAHHRGPFLSGAPRRQDGNYAENNCQQAGGNSFSHVVISFFYMAVCYLISSSGLLFEYPVNKIISSLFSHVNMYINSS